jgi:Leucine-rich repeat (LRR) protein
MKKLFFIFALLVCMSGNTQAQVAKSLAEMTDKIDSLDLSKQNLTQIPTEVFQYKNLKDLDLSENPLISLPKKLENLKI